ncbi:MAG: hypothetical protein PHQ36_12430, partial [Anaerolineales bacterium]|nr:hypothetical protein [Anaerolineales bacterium]
MENQNHTLTLQPRLSAKILFVAALVISAFTFIGQYLTLFPAAFRVRNPIGAYILDKYFVLEFRLNTESNVVIYFAAFILLAAIAALLFLIALYKDAAKDKFKFYWYALAAFFLYLSVDKAAILPGKHVKFFNEWTDQNGWFEFRWAFVIAALILLGLLFRKFLLHFEPKFRTLLLTSTILYYVGVFGVELFGGRYTSWFGNQNLGLAALSCASELMEFGGLILAIYALLLYMETHLPNIRFLMRPETRAAENKEHIQIVQPLRVLKAFVILAFGFSVFSFIGQIFRLFPDYYTIHSPLQEVLLSIFIYQFGVNTEANIATHFATIILVIVAALFLVVALLKIAAKDKYRLGWLVLSLFVLYLSIDEQCVLHEKLSWIFSNWTNFNGWFEYKWVIPGFIGVAVFAAIYIPFFLHLETKFKILFIIAAVMYFTGALGSEIISGHWASSHGTKNITYSLMTLFEELLEFNGVNLLMYSLLHYIQLYFGEVVLTVRSRNAS